MASPGASALDELTTLEVTGDLLVVPDERHSLHALDDSAVLLTVAKR